MWLLVVIIMEIISQKIERIFFCLAYYNDKKNLLYNVRNLVMHQLDNIASLKTTEKVVIQSVSSISECVLYCCRIDRDISSNSVV